MLQSKEIILRDLRESDIEKRLYWETVETEWQRWDAPWEFEGVTGSQKQEQLRALEGFLRMCAAETMPEGMKRRTFHMETLEEEPRYIGWVISYYINENCVFTTNITNRCAVGIDIPDRSARGKGYAYQALCLYMDYLFAHGETDL